MESSLYNATMPTAAKKAPEPEPKPSLQSLTVSSGIVNSS